jgi:phage tail-like protein
MPATEKTMLAQAHPAFRFVVKVDGETNGVFTECTLPTLEWEVEEVKEGGQNSYVHQLPGRRKATRVTLKNGLGKDDLKRWYLMGLTHGVSKEYRKTVSITLLDSMHKTVMVWNIANAYPVKWTGPQLKTDSNTIAIQSLELICGEITVSDSGSVGQN